MKDPLAKLRRVVRQSNWVALDTETTDLGRNAELVEIAIVDADGDSFISLIRPGVPLSPGAAALHGIEPLALTTAPTFSEVATEVRRRLAGRTILVYNADFDRRVLWREFARVGQPAPRGRWVCLCDIVTEWSGRRHTLAGAMRKADLECSDRSHRALDDARAVAALARSLAQRQSLTGEASS